MMLLSMPTKLLHILQLFIAAFESLPLGQRGLLRRGICDIWKRMIIGITSKIPTPCGDDLVA